MNGASKRIKITDLNPNLICVLCGGYFIDATTLTECLHSFCKKCIVKYLETSKQCPVCDVLVHKTRPHLHIRSDKTLQDLVYKLVPGLYKSTSGEQVTPECTENAFFDEMKRRRDFYSKHPEVAPKKVGEERGDEMAERIIYTEDEHFSLALHFSKRGVRDERSVRSLTLPEVVAVSKEPPKNVRYLRCPAGVTIGILKKFVRLKYELPGRYEIDIFHTDEALHEDYTLMDIAYIYTWRRKDPLRLNYSVYESKVKRPRLAIEPLPNTPGLKPVKTESGATLIKEEDRSSGKQDGARPLVKPDLKPACSQDKKPASKPEADQKEIKTFDKLVVKTQEQKSEGGPHLLLLEDKKWHSTSTEEPAVSPSKQEPRITNLIPPSYVTVDTATPKPASYSSPQILADKAAVRLGTACAVKILQSSNPSSPSPGPTMKGKPVKPAGNTTRIVSAKVAMTTQMTAVGKSSSQENFLTKSKPLLASASKILTPSSKASEVQAAMGAAHTPDVIRKAPPLSFPSPAGAPALSRTSSSSNASISTKSNGASQTTCRLAGSVTTICTSSAASTSTTTTMAVSAPTASTNEQTPAAQSLVLAVSAHDVPVIADAGAAAASATVPAPAALAASSSPSPPMASTAASVKEPEEMQTCSTPPSTPSSSSSSSSLPAPGPMQSTLRPTPTLAKMALTAQKTVRPAEVRASAKATDAKIVVAAKTAVPEVTQSSALPATGKGTAAACVASSKTVACSKTFARKSEEVSRVVTVSSSDEGVSEKDREAAGVSKGSDSNRKDDKVQTASPVTSSSSKVAVGIPSFVSTNCDSVGSLAGRGRVCNGMPPVVTRMLRMSNASTSVNTLPQKLHAKVGQQQQQQQQQQQVSQQAARALSRNTPPVVQPAALPATTHSLVRTSPGSAIAVAMAKRRASEMQALQQQLQLIQQHQLLSIQAAAAARWTTDVLSPSPPRVSAMTPSASSPTSAHANTLGVVASQSGVESCSSKDPREVGGISPPNKKQEGSGQQQLAKQQKHGMYKKLAEASPSKKKISDIANTLHKKISQSCGGSTKADLAADGKRPPNAHSASKSKAPEAAAGGQQAHAHSKASFPANSAPCDREDEPLNLVTRDKDLHRHSNRGASPRVQTTTAV